MEFRHTSVLLDSSIENLAIKPDGIYVDGTLGGGGHASHICQALSKHGTLIGIDRDRDAIFTARERLERFDCRKFFVRSNYADIKSVLADLQIDHIDGAILDLGVSSFQLDNQERGFSYMQDAPLDMRMNQEDPVTAADIIATYSQKDLTRIIKTYGEERWAARIAQFIVQARQNGPIETTGQLVDIIKAAVPKGARRDGPHPAKRTFQAIRIEVNDELALLEQAVEDFCDVLGPGGRLCIISFHSLEDRIVKEVMARRANPCTCPPELPVCICGKRADVSRITRKPILPSEEELLENPRARSAKLRVCEKLSQ